MTSTRAAGDTGLRSLDQLDVNGKHAFVRVDFNVPSKDGQIGDDSRIRAALPTIQYLLDHHTAIILGSHLGRPKGKPSADLSLAPVAQRLSELLDRPVEMAPDSIGPDVQRLADHLQPQQILLLENLRFHPEEEKNDPEFAARLAKLADVYVDDAFGTAHRAHASTEGMARLLPNAAGLLMEREIRALSLVLENPEHAFTAIIGGAKISTKIGLLENLLDRVDSLIIGGGMANTFFAAQGYEMGSSLVEEDLIETARSLLDRDRNEDKIQLPVDVVVTDDLSGAGEQKVVQPDDVPLGRAIVDIGPDSIEAFGGRIDSSKTVLWNGPMGIFEVPAFARGTSALAERLAKSEAVSIVGGGDSVAAIEQLGLSDRITHVSTGGGASLEFLEGRELPGIKVLRRDT